MKNVNTNFLNYADDGVVVAMSFNCYCAKDRRRPGSTVPAAARRGRPFGVGGTVRTSIGIRRQPKEVRDRIRRAFDRLVQTYAKDGGIQIPVAFKVAARRLA